MMKQMDLKKWENFNGLPSEQEEDLYELFTSFMDMNDIESYEDVKELFKSGTDTFTGFLLALEKNTDWFDFTQMPQIFDEISLYIEQLNGDDDMDDWDEQ